MKLNMTRLPHRLTKRMIERLSKQSYYTARAYYSYQLRHIDRCYKDLPILVYQMGKVGSSTVVKSLKMSNLERRIYHIHFLTPDLIEKNEAKRKRFLRTPWEGRLKHIWQYQYLYQWIQRGTNGKKWKVITLVRDPVARNLSTFFENIEVLVSESDQQWRLRSVEYDFEITIKNNNLDELIALFFERCRHETPLIFFDREINGIFNVNVYDSDFPKSKGYKIYTGQNVDILLIRLENLDSCIAEALKQFLNIDELVLIQENVGSQKDYADIYQIFKGSIYLSDSYINDLYSSKFARHFYTESEIAQFRTKWSRQPVG